MRQQQLRLMALSQESEWRHNKMKYVIVLGDGMADEPIAELGNKTPLEYATTPKMDSMSKMS